MRLQTELQVMTVSQLELGSTLPGSLPCWLVIFYSWLDHESLPQAVNMGIITLLYKKDDPFNIKNYRPITLTNSVYKILSRILCNRLKSVLDNIVGPTQTCIPGRYIGSNIRTLLDVIDHSKVTKSPLGILLLDQEKAFDKVSMKFLFIVMKKLGFNDTFIRWISTLYKDAKSFIRLGRDTIKANFT